MSSESRESVRLANWQRRLFRKVVDTYLEKRTLQPVVASNVDPTPGAQSHRWSPGTAHFVIDVQHALRDAIKDQTDRKELSAAWARLLVDESHIGLKEARLIGLVAPLMKARQLDPALYFGGPKRARA